LRAWLRSFLQKVSHRSANFDVWLREKQFVGLELLAREQNEVTQLDVFCLTYCIVWVEERERELGEYSQTV
jgi:hypothetical protein